MLNWKSVCRGELPNLNLADDIVCVGDSCYWQTVAGQRLAHGAVAYYQRKCEVYSYKGKPVIVFADAKNTTTLLIEDRFYVEALDGARIVLKDRDVGYAIIEIVEGGGVRFHRRLSDVYLFVLVNGQIELRQELHQGRFYRLGYERLWSWRAGLNQEPLYVFGTKGLWNRENVWNRVSYKFCDGSKRIIVLDEGGDRTVRVVKVQKGQDISRLGVILAVDYDRYGRGMAVVVDRAQE